MSKWLKTAFFIALLVGVGYFFGIVCGKFGQVYRWLLPPSKEIIDPLIRLAVGVGVFAIAAGLVVALVRPVWVGLIGFALSGLAILLGWQVHIVGVVLVSVYLIAAIVYSFGVARDLNERVRFSLRPLRERQGMLLTTLLLVACGSFYLEYSSVIEREGFSLPEGFIELMAGGVERQVGPDEQGEMPPEAMDELRAGIRENMTRVFEGMMEPYERFVPLMMAVSLFTIFQTAISILAWVPITVLELIFSLLKVARITRIESGTMEVERLVMD
jgi:hypothetical protein